MVNFFARSTDGGNLIIGSNHEIRVWTSNVYSESNAFSTQKMFINSSGVGINNNNPSYALDITGDLRLSGAVLPTTCNQQDLGSANYRWRDIYLSGNTIDLGGTLLTRSEDGGGLSITTSDNQTVPLATGDVYASGNIGVGLSNPIERLEVIGNVKANAFIGSGAQLTGLANVAFTGDHNSLSNTVFTLQTPTTASFSGKIGIGGNANLNKQLYVTGNMEATGSLVANSVTASNLYIVGDTTVLNTISSNTEQMVITNAGTGPALKVVQTGASSIHSVAEFYDGDDTTNAALVVANGGFVGLGTTTPLSRLHVYHTGSGNILRVDDATAPDTTPFIINEEGNVGIGTATPLRTLDVNGVVKATQFIGDGSLLTGVSGGGGGSGSSVWTTVQTSNVYVGSGSNVGIGTSTPQANFHVFASGASNILRIDGGSNVTPLVVNRLGYIGIGTENPQYNLHMSSGTTFASTCNYSISNEYPPSAMTTNTQTISGITYTVTASPGSYSPYVVFAKDFNSGGNQWLTATNYNSSTGLYNNTYSTVVSGSTVYGDWLQVSLSSSITINQLVHYSGGQSASSPTRHPRKFTLAGSTDGGTTWFNLLTATGITWPGVNTPVTYSFTEQSVSVIRIIIQENVSGAYASYAEIGELIFKYSKSVDYSFVIKDGNVGIGTTLPTNLLHVNGVVKATQYIGDGSQLTGMTPPSAWSNLGSNVYIIGSNVGIGTSTPTNLLHVNGVMKATQYIGDGSLLTGVSTAWLSQGSNVYITGSNVGIGTSTPTNLLHVNGVMKATQYIGDGSLLTGVLTSVSTTWSSQGSNVYITGSNVGIGTTNPQANLHINYTGVSDVIRIDDDAAPDLTPFVINNTGDLGIGTGSPQFNLHMYKKNFANTSNYSVSSEYPPQALTTNSPQAISGVTYTPTSSPGDGYADNPYLVFNRNYNSSGNDWLTASSYNTSTGAYTGASGQSTVVSGTTIGGDWVQLTTSSSITVNQLIHYSGGQGTSSPTRHPRKFTVAGSTDGVTWFTVMSASNVTWPGLNTPVTYSFNEVTVSRLRFIIQETTPGGYANYGEIGDLLFKYNNTVDVYSMVIRDGNVGIGTSTPTRALDVSGVVKATQYIGDGSLLTNVAAPSNMYIIGGNVGIGTSTPTRTLDVNGVVKATQFIGNGSLITGISGLVWSSQGSNTYVTGNNIGIGTTNPQANLHINYTGVSDVIRLDDETAPDYSPFVINQYGNVGVGVSNPLYKMHVDGSMFMTSLNTSPTTYPEPRYPAYSNVWGATGALYVASGTSSNNAVYTVPEYAFNKVGNQGTSWLSAGVYNSSTGAYTGSVSTSGFLGEWLQIQLPALTYVTSITIRNDGNGLYTGFPKTFKLFGSLNGTQWIEVMSVTNATNPGADGVSTFNVQSPGAYTYYRLVTNAISGGANYLSISELELNASRNRNGFISLVNGNIGVGTNAPIYPCHVYNTDFCVSTSNITISEYPPYGLTANTQTMESIQYIASASSTSGNPIYYAFDKQFTYTNSWYSGYFKYDATTGAYTGYTTPVSTVVSGVTVPGEWIQLQFDQTVTINRFVHVAGAETDAGVGRHPKKITFAGSTNGSTWTLLTSASNIAWPGEFRPASYTFASTNVSYVRMIVQEIVGGGQPGHSGLACICELQVFSDQTYNKATMIKNGDLGVGTTTPVQPLHVQGNAFITGNVGIGVTSPGYQLVLSTDSAAKPTSSTWTVSSDERVKQDIELADLDRCYAVVQSLQLKRFRWDSNVLPNVPDRHMLGWIAQEVEQVIPNAVTYTQNYGYDDMRSLDGDQIIKFMYGALQKSISCIQELSTSNAVLFSKNEELISEINAIKVFTNMQQ